MRKTYYFIYEKIYSNKSKVRNVIEIIATSLPVAKKMMDSYGYNSYTRITKAQAKKL